MDVQFCAAESYDPDGEITRWTWDFGDGHTDSGEAVAHRYVEPGTYLVRLTVRDNRGASSVATTTIEAVEADILPEARLTAIPSSGEAPLWVTFDASGSTSWRGTIEQYAWEFGDGATSSGERVSHMYDVPGTYVVRLTVTDDLSQQGSATTEIEVRQASPFVRRFQWEYAGRSFDLTLSIPSALYHEYRKRPRGLWEHRDYDEYVLDPLDDEFLEGVIGWIESQVGTDYYAVVECTFHFVQAAIAYQFDPVLYYEYPKYPVETLVDRAGDCEDTAILYAALVRTLGAGARLAAVDTSGNGVPDHMITLVPVSQSYADSVTCTRGHAKSFWTYDGQLYAFAETTGSPDVLGYYLALGCDPWGLSGDDFKIIWDVSGASVSPKVERWMPVRAVP